MPIDLNNVEWEEVKVDPVNVVWDDPPAPEFPAVQNQYVDNTKTGESLAYSTLLNIAPEQAYLNHDELKQAFSNQVDSKPMSGAGGDFAVDPPRNPLEEIDAAIRAGGIGALENYARLADLAGMDMMDKVNLFTAMGESWAPSRPGTAWHSIYGGFRGTIESLATALPGAALGAVIGSKVPIVGTAAGAVTGFVLGPGMVFSLAEYHRFMGEVEQLGLSREAHKGKAVISAVAEGGIEALTNLAGAKIFGFIGKGILSEPVKQGLMQAFGRFLGRVGMVQSVEVPGEMATAAIQNNQRRKAGIDTGMTDWEAAKSAAGPAFVQGLLMGGAFQAGRGLRPGEVQPTQPIDQGERVEPVVTVTEEAPKAEEKAALAKKDERKAKEPWEMTADEFAKHIRKTQPNAESYIEAIRIGEIRQALAEGKPVPKKVLKDYPGLQKPEKIVPVPELKPTKPKEVPPVPTGAARLVEPKQKPAEKVEAKEPWEMTKEEYRQVHVKSKTDEILAKKVGGKSPQDVLDYYKKKYPQLKGIELGRLDETKRSGPLTDEGAVKILLNKDGSFNTKRSGIFITEDASLTTVRHEIEHLLDVIHDRKYATVATFLRFARFSHEKFPSEYAHKQLVKQALSEGKSVPPEVLRDYPDLQPVTPITKPITDEAIYEENRQASKRVAVQETKKALVETKRSVGKLVDELLGPISTRIGIISPKVKNTLKRFEYDYRMQIKKDTIAVKPILERSSKEMTPEDFADFDLARKNSDTTKIMELLTKYNLFDEYKTLRKTLDAVRKRAKEVGYDVNFIEDYHPRVLKDPEGFLEYFQKGKDWDIISRAIKEREDESGKMSPEEKAQFVNSLIQGYQHGQAKPSSFKGRTIQMIDAKLNQFYMSSHGALTAYIRQTNEAIEAKRFFGRGEKATDFTHVEDSIGAYVIGEIAEGNIRPDQEAELTKILRARFEARGPGKVIGTLRDLAYIDVMGSPISAITQIGDLTWALYKYGLESTGKGVWNALKGKPLLSKEDIGIEGIVQEFEDPSRASDLLRTVFKLTGLEKIDRIGKEALIETTIRDYQARAKKDAATLKKELRPIFGKETNQVIKDLQTGELSENVGYLGFSRLLDFQPVALSEMPETYLRTTNGRIFYMLKTFTIKQFDIFRREAFQKIKSKDPKIVKEGLRNLVVLSSIFVLLNATADEIKDFILGRKTSFKDRLIDNIFRLFGVSKFITWTARMEGWGTALLKQMLPPMQFVNSLASGDPKKLLKSIPFVGKIFYWRTKEEKPKKGRRKSTRRKPE